jgi:drug/metabolite transporter (DMT)-like permease
MFAVMGAFVVAVKRVDQESMAFVASFVRTFVNLVVVLVGSNFIKSNSGQPLGLSGLFGDRSVTLWLRGLFGTLSVVSYFYGVNAIGLGEASFFNASNAFWIGLLGSSVLGQRNTKLGWLAITVGMVGLFFLLKPEPIHEDFSGRFIALASGLFGALAYLMVSKSGRTNHPWSVVFYFVFVAVIVHVIAMLFMEIHWPTTVLPWIFLIASGIAASIAQHFMTLAYQNAPAAIVASVGFMTPMVGTLIGVLFFEDKLQMEAIVGCCLILVAGIGLPYLQSIQRQRL